MQVEVVEGAEEEEVAGTETTAERGGTEEARAPLTRRTKEEQVDQETVLLRI